MFFRNFLMIATNSSVSHMLIDLLWWYINANLYEMDDAYFLQFCTHIASLFIVLHKCSTFWRFARCTNVTLAVLWLRNSHPGNNQMVPKIKTVEEEKQYFIIANLLIYWIFLLFTKPGKMCLHDWNWEQQRF